MRRCALAFLGVFVFATAAAAQPAPDSRFSVSVAGGLGTGHQAGGALGASFAVAVNSRLDAQFETTYADRGPGVEAYSFEGRLHVALAPRTARFVPHVIAGGGAYRTEFNMAHGGMFGRFDDMPGVQFGMQRGTYGHGSMWGTFGWPQTTTPVPMPHIPSFYGQRMGLITPGVFGTQGGVRRFTDPAAVFGGGLTFNASPRIYLRPEARALTVFANGDTYTVGFFTLGVGVRF